MSATARFLLCSLALVAGAGPANAAAPRLALAERAFDFGTVERGSKVEHTFALPNRGDGVLLIDHVKSSCGCTVAVVSAHEIPSATDARVTVTVDTAHMAGRVTKIVTVYTNDPDNPVLPLTMTGQVAADLLITPTPLYLGHVRRGDRTRHEVVVVPGRAGTTFAVTGVDSPARSSTPSSSRAPTDRASGSWWTSTRTPRSAGSARNSLCAPRARANRRSPFPSLAASRERWWYCRPR